MIKTKKLIEVNIGFAKRLDDVLIRSLLNKNYVGGDIKLSYTRNPNFFKSLELQGILNYPIVAKLTNGTVVGLAIISIQRFNIDGVQKDSLYVHSIRVDKTYRKNKIFSKMVNFAKQFFSDELFSNKFIHFTLIKNNFANKFILKKTHNTVKMIDSLTTHILFPNKYKLKQNHLQNNLKGFQIKEVIPTKQNIFKFCKYYNEFNKQKPYFQELDSKFLKNILDLCPESKIYFVFDNASNSILCTFGLWSQSSLKQIVPKGYSFKLKLLLSILKLSLIKNFNLPRINKKLNFTYLSFLSFKSSNVALKHIINYAQKEVIRKKYDFLSITLSSKFDKNIELLLDRTYLVQYKSNLYIGNLKDVLNSKNNKYYSKIFKADLSGGYLEGGLL